MADSSIANDPRIKRIKAARRKEQSGQIWYDIRKALTGRVDAAGTDDPTSGLAAGYIWTHGESERPEVPALHVGRVSTRASNAQILIGNRVTDGALEVITLDGLLATLQYGGAIGAIATPTVPSELQPFGSKLREFYAIPDPDLGGLYLYVYPGWYDGAYWAGGRLLLVPTATASMKAGVVVGFDETTGALVQALTADRSLAYTAPPAADVATAWDTATFANARPVAVVWLANGATSIDTANVTDIRDLVATGGGSAAAGDMTKAVYDTDDDGLVEQLAFQIVESDPGSPAEGEAWVLKSLDAGNSGSPIGLLLALTTTTHTYQLSVYADGAARRTTLS